MKLLAIIASCVIAVAIKCVASDEPAKPESIAIDSSKLESFPCDVGSIKFIAPIERTKGQYSVMEVTERPGYKTAWHKHPDAEESFYVLEGVLTFQLRDKIYELPAGSYVLIPRGTPHAHGNFTGSSAKFILTFTPGGFEEFQRDRIELGKTVKRDDPEFQKRFDELRARHKEHVEILGEWNPPVARPQ